MEQSALFAGFGHWHAFARATVQIPGIALAIPAQQFQQAALRSEGIRDIVLRYKETLLAQVCQAAGCNALHSLEMRLARWLLQASDRAELPPAMLTHDLLSQLLGARRTIVTLLATRLKENGLIQYRRGRIAILDRARLEAMTCECYRIIRQRSEPHRQPAVLPPPASIAG
jgi:CRP-like cAMP-binding protein